MNQGPRNTTITLIEYALQSNNIESAIEHINYCSSNNAEAIHDVIFNHLLKGTFQFLKEIRKLTPKVWLAFLGRNDLCSEIGAKKLGKILKKIIAILKKLYTEREYDNKVTELIDLYHGVLFLIAKNNEIIECVKQEKSFLSAEHKEFVLQKLQMSPDIDKDICAAYEPDEQDNDLFIASNDYLDESSDSFTMGNSNEPSYEELKNPNIRRRYRFTEYLKIFYKEYAVQQFIITNQDGFLLSIDPFNINKYIFSSSIFKEHEKKMVLLILIQTLESNDKTQQERAKYILKYLLCNNKEVLKRLNHDMTGVLNTSALLQLSLCTLALYAPEANTPERKLKILKACLLPLGRAMDQKRHIVNEFFCDVNHLDSLCLLYYFCYEKECMKIWDDFWVTYNALHDYRFLLDSVHNRYPEFLYQKALGHLTLGKKDVLSEKLAIGYLSKAIQHGYIVAHLALSAIYSRQKKYQQMESSALSFLTAQQANQAPPRKSSTNYRFLFEIYYAYSRHVKENVDHFTNELNRVYPGIVRAFDDTISKPMFDKKPRIIGNDLREPIDILRARLEQLRFSAQQLPITDPLDVVSAPLLQTTRVQVSGQNIPYYQESPLPSFVSPRK